jgi:hypothetical protein
LRPHPNPVVVFSRIRPNHPATDRAINAADKTWLGSSVPAQQEVRDALRYKAWPYLPTLSTHCEQTNLAARTQQSAVQPTQGGNCLPASAGRGCVKARRGRNFRGHRTHTATTIGDPEPIWKIDST